MALGSMCPLGEKGEYLLKLDDGVEQDPEGNFIDFDYITDESLAAIDNYEDLSNYIDIHEYLATTNRLPPEHALQAEEEGYETASEEMLEYDLPRRRSNCSPKSNHGQADQDDTTCMSFNQFSRTDATP